MPDPLQSYLDRTPLTKTQKADIWDAYHSAPDVDAFAGTLDGLKVPKGAKADLWDLKAAETPAPEAQPETPETPFPTPGETAGRMVMGGLKAIPNMVMGVLGTPKAIIEGVGNPLATGQRLKDMASGVITGGQEIATPLAKTIVSGVGTVTPEEMNAAADTGGTAIANLAAPELARGGVAVAGKLTPSMGKLLKFAPPAVMAAAGHPVIAAKMLMKGALTEAILKPMGNIVIDHVLDRIAARDAEGVAAGLARGLERSPAAQEAFAQALEHEANKAAPPGGPEFRPIGNSPADVAARNALKQARRPLAPIPDRPIAPAAPQTLKRPSFVDEAAGVHAPPDTMPNGYRRGSANPMPPPKIQMPVPGNVKPATIYTKPGPKLKGAPGESPSAKALATKQAKVADPEAIRAAFETKPKGATPHGTKGPSGAPLTAAERRAALIKLQESIAAGADIFEAFGIGN